MIKHRIIERPAFEVVGKKTWISGQDNALFGKFWTQCREEGLFATFEAISGLQSGAQTNGSVLGISCVEKDPSNRAFYYLIAVEKPKDYQQDDLEIYQIPASQWAVFECWGKGPDSLVKSEMYAFMEWLPSSRYVHAYAPEIEVYPPNAEEEYCEFWLPIMSKP